MEGLSEEECRAKVCRVIGYPEPPLHKPKNRALLQELTVLAAPDPVLSERCLTWLAGLSPGKRQRAVAIYDPWFASMLRHMFSSKIERGDLIFQFTEKKKWKCFKPFSYYFYPRVCTTPPEEERQEAERLLEQNLRMADWGSYLDTLTVDPALAEDFPRFLDLMSCISKRKAFQAPCKPRLYEESKVWFFDSPPWLFPAFNSLAVWAGSWLERGIWMNFWKSASPDPRLDILNEPKTQLLQDLESLSQYWTSRGAAEQEELLSNAQHSAAKFAEAVPALLCQTTVTLEGNGKSLRVGSLHKSVGCYYQRHYSIVEHNNEPEVVQDLIRRARESPRTLVEFLLLSSLDRTMTLLDILCRQLAVKLAARWSQYVVSSLLDELEAAPSKPATNKDTKKKKRSKQRLKEAVAEDAEELCGALVRSIVDSALQQVNREPQSWPFVAQPSSTNLLAKMQELNPPSKAKKQKKKKPKRSKKAQIGDVVGASPAVKKTMQPTARLHQEITSFCQALATRLQALESARTLLIDSLKEVCSGLFPESELIVYGSYPTGLALESSDIDTVVLGLSKDAHSRSLKSLGSALKAQAWVSQVTVIETASVPIVKLEALADGQLTKLDVTFDDRKAGDAGTHLGVERLAYTQELLLELQPLRELTLILKSLLARHEMNSAYRGYLSSYSLLLWAAARLRTSDWSGRDLGQLLTDFFSFYADFDPQRIGINLTQSPCYFPLPPGLYHAVTLDPVAQTNNTTWNAYNLQQVLGLFQTCAVQLLDPEQVSLHTILG